MLHRVLHPLSRKLAVRLARKRRHGRKGPLDFRATMRRSLSTGGVPIEPRFRHPRPAKPEIFVIADISGSVASFARFTLHLVYAISSQFSKVRSFVFVDGIDEVTRFFEGVVDPAEAVARINTEADVIWVDGHSDYGHALTEFHRRWGDQVTSRSSVMVLGDARNNYHASQSWVLEDLQARARHVYWLNPEPRDYWGSGDSIVGEYAAHCDDVVECRTLRQLEHFVGQPGVNDRVTTATPGSCASSRRHRARRASSWSATARPSATSTGSWAGSRAVRGLTELGRRQVAVLADRLYESGELRGADGPLRLGAATGGRDGRAAPAGRRPRTNGARSGAGSAATCASCTRGSATACHGRTSSRRSGYPTGTATRASPSRPGGESWTSFVVRASDGRPRRGRAPTRGSSWWRRCTPVSSRRP